MEGVSLTVPTGHQWLSSVRYFWALKSSFSFDVKSFGIYSAQHTDEHLNAYRDARAEA